MNIWIHSTIVATSLAATVAVAFAAAAIYTTTQDVAAKADRLPIAQRLSSDSRYMTVETRGEQLSVLERVPVMTTASK